MTDPALFPTLQANLSPDRLRPYIVAEGGDLGRGLRLYTWQIEVSAAFWGVLHIVEVGLRNALHTQLTTRFGQADWWDSPRVHLTRVGQEMVEVAKSSAQKSAGRNGRQQVPGDVVAALSFGFWSSLTGKGGKNQYETQFWQPALVKAFPNMPSGTKRGTVNQTLESVRLFRNRVAHHEPIFGRHLAADHAALLRIAGDIDTDLRRYVTEHSRVPAVLARRADCVSTGEGSSF